MPQKIDKSYITQRDFTDSNSMFANEALITLNQYRTLHNVPPLRYNDQLSKIAQRWADNLAQTRKLQHSPIEMRQYRGVGLGENLCFLSGPSVLNGERMIQMWYREAQVHDFNQDFQPNTQNFSQMVWRESSEVGFGRSKGPNDECYYGVAVFMPIGNVRGRYQDNVFPPSN